jgi:hypothetical protein
MPPTLLDFLDPGNGGRRLLQNVDKCTGQHGVISWTLCIFVNTAVRMSRRVSSDSITVRSHCSKWHLWRRLPTKILREFLFPRAHMAIGPRLRCPGSTKWLPITKPVVMYCERAEVARSLYSSWVRYPFVMHFSWLELSGEYCIVMVCGVMVKAFISGHGKAVAPPPPPPPGALSCRTSVL